MLLSLDWLKDYVDIPKSKQPEELGLDLTIHTVEVDSIKKQADKFNRIIVGKITEIKQHPNADRLQIAGIDIGDADAHFEKPLIVVTGAPDIEVGQLVPVALPGAILPTGIEIEEAELRGVKSFGMLCAEDELGLGADHSGIMVLERQAKIGQNLSDYLGLKDTIFELDNKSLTHRPDLWSHYGIAREISVFLGTKFKEYKPVKEILSKSTNELEIKAKVEDFQTCPRYMAIALSGIQVGDSPRWIAERLIAAGMRPINNIVDITNYVMLEFGQPMHAFDADLLGNKIVVRKAKNNEIVETLDGEQRKLGTDNLLITNGEKGVAVAGVMGCANSEINDKTKKIILECANFEFISIRRTSQKLGLRTESSMRFEKALDPNLCELALARAVELIIKACPKAKVVSNLVDEKKFILDQGPITLDLNWVKEKIGAEIKQEKIQEILKGLGFTLEQNENILSVTVPTWRATRDVSIREDLVEEIARIYGYDNIEPVKPDVKMEIPDQNEERLLIRKIKDILIGSPALTETYNYSFVDEAQLKKMDIDFSYHVRLANPIASNQTLLRQSLAPNLITNIKTNQAKFEEVGLFEIGSIFSSIQGDLAKTKGGDDFLPFQEKHLGIIYATSAKGTSISRVKGCVQHLLSWFDLEPVYTECEIKIPWREADECADIYVGEIRVGQVVKLAESKAKALGVKKEAVVCEIVLRDLLNAVKSKKDKKYQRHDKFPAVIRDLSFVINTEILYNDIKGTIINFDPLIKELELFDVYQGDKLGEGKKSLAFRIIYQADRTLTSEEVDAIQKKLIEKMESEFEAKVRDF